MRYRYDEIFSFILNNKALAPRTLTSCIQSNKALHKSLEETFTMISTYTDIQVSIQQLDISELEHSD